ncbi:response regulator transcription factor [Massilia sp. CF038]|uniref:response regulator n=1 Tax=Massilia sp. CF038 TaxID=1881045 RepID=UPI00091C7EEA|nr:response regulator transcription factor [Massilia sp. CF038]SHG50643.1 two component transcriptional regulator, LuxR family [Massilia sp. CF038]
MQVQEKTIQVMLVDDHKTMLWGLQRLLESAHAGITVVASATTLEEARAALAQCVPDVVLLDLDLNGVCAIDLLPLFLTNERTRVLIFTGSRDDALLERAIRGGARGLLRKDAPAELVLKAVTKVSEGELWIEHAMMARVLNELTRPAVPRRPDPEAQRLASLTAREHKIIASIVSGNGAPNHSLAQSLFISEHTLRNHLVSIYKKLGVANRLELYVYAVKHQLGTQEISTS